MKLVGPVPFYANLQDDMHCVQAALRMILKYFLPDRDFSWEDLEKMTAKLPNKSTWPSQMLVNLKEMNFDVALIEGFDAVKFIDNGEEYLKEAFGSEAAAWQIANSDIPAEQRLYQKMLDEGVHYENRIPTTEDLRKYLSEGYLIEVIINSRKLNRSEGYVGHSVVIYDMDGQWVTFHDPGLPAREARVETIADFEAAWADPNDKAKSLIAVKYKG